MLRMEPLSQVVPLIVCLLLGLPDLSQLYHSFGNFQTTLTVNSAKLYPTKLNLTIALARPINFYQAASESHYLNAFAYWNCHVVNNIPVVNHVS